MVSKLQFYITERPSVTLTPYPQEQTFSISFISFVQSGVVSGSESLESARVRRRVAVDDFTLNRTFSICLGFFERTVP